MTRDEMIEVIAEEIWQSENIRIHGKRRSVEWPEDVHPELVDSYKLTATHLANCGIFIPSNPRHT